MLPQSQASAPPPESPTPNMSHKLVEENNRLREEFDRFKRDLDAQYKIELACQKKNLERQYEQETQNTVAKLRQDLDNTQRLVDNRLVETETLQHQTKTLEEQVKALREENERLKQQPGYIRHHPLWYTGQCVSPPPTYHSQHQTPHVSFAPPIERHLTASHRSHNISMAQAHTHNASMDNSLTMVLDRFERSLTLQNNAIQESLALSANSFREHHLSAAKPCDGKDPKGFEHCWMMFKDWPL